MSQRLAPDWAEEEDHSSPFDLKILLLYGVFRSKIWVALLGAIGLLGGLLYGASLPNVYRSSALLYYQAGMQEAMTEETLLGITPENQRLIAPGIMDEIMLLDDLTIYEGIAREMTPDYILESEVPTAQDNDGTPFPVKVMHRLQKLLQERSRNDTGDSPVRLAWTAKHLRAKTSLDPIRSTSYIRVSYLGYAPDRAQEICRNLMDAFLERHVDVYGVGKKLEEQGTKVFEAFQELGRREDVYIKYRNQCGVWDYEVEAEKNRLALEQIQADLRTVEIELDKVNAKVAAYQALMDDTEPLIEQTTDPVIARNPLVAEYESRLNQLDIEEIQARSRSLRESDVKPTLDRIERERTSFQAQLEQLPETVEIESSRVETVVNEQFYIYQGKLVDLEAERDALMAGVKGLKVEFDLAKEYRDKISMCQADHGRHNRSLDQAQLEYERQSEVLATLEKMAVREESGSANLKIRQEAQLPLTKEGPNRWKPLALGMFAGLAAGVGIAVLRQLLDRRVRYPESVEKTLGVKVLGVVPDARRLRSFPKSSPAA